MDSELKAARLIVHKTLLELRMAGMHAENENRIRAGLPITYGEVQFREVEREFRNFFEHVDPAEEPNRERTAKQKSAHRENGLAALGLAILMGIGGFLAADILVGLVISTGFLAGYVAVDSFIGGPR